MIYCHENRRLPPMIHQEVNCEEEEEDIDHLENKNVDVEVNKLRRIKESRPHFISVVVFLPLFTPWITKKAVSYTHAGEDQVGRSKLVHQGSEDTEQERTTLGEY